MTLSRREFLKVSGALTGALLLPHSAAWAASGVKTDGTAPMGMLSDLTKCIGCGWCLKACREWNQLPGDGDGSEAPCLSAHSWTGTEFTQVKVGSEEQRIFAKKQCMHCLHPACVSACPVGALQKLDSGPVVYDPSRCIGCRYCMVACPFGIPKFEWEETLPCVSKCNFCADRQKDGLVTACAEACPTGALTFGPRDELIAEAQARIAAAPDEYVDHIYGQHELGGTSWMYLSPVPFAKLGFPVLEEKSVTSLSEAVATWGTGGVALGVAGLLGWVYATCRRRDEEVLVDAQDLEQESEVES